MPPTTLNSEEPVIIPTSRVGGGEAGQPSSGKDAHRRPHLQRVARGRFATFSGNELEEDLYRS